MTTTPPSSETTQLHLDLGTIASDPDAPDDLTIQQAFERFHGLNPWVYEALAALTADYVTQGQRRVGIRMLWEVLRWRYNRQTRDPNSLFKVNDHYHSRYVRLLIEQHPEWAEVFETRVLRAA